MKNMKCNQEIRWHIISRKHQQQRSMWHQNDLYSRLFENPNKINDNDLKELEEEEIYEKF